MVGLLGGATVVSLAGMGVVIAGPLGAGAGAVVGGILGAIRGWSVHKDHIPKYEEKIKSGHVLVLAHSSDPRLIAALKKRCEAHSRWKSACTHRSTMPTTRAWMI